MEKKPSIIGGACIIASVCVGAGMLGLPSSGAGAWTLWSILVICFTMIMMTLSGWLLLESYKPYKDLRVSFSTVTKDLLGAKVNFINNLAVYFVGGILLYAYITSSGRTIAELMAPFIDMGPMANKIWSIIFVLVFSAFVSHSTKAVDRISVLLILTMFLTFIFSLSGLAANIDFTVLFDTHSDGNYAKYAIGLFPVALTSFGYHHSVSSMRFYYGEEHRAKYAILFGTSIALVFYLLWVISIFGNLPRNDFAPVIQGDGDINVLLNALSDVIESKKINSILNAFSFAALLSSFIGVGLGVFDYLADFFQFDNSRLGRTKTWLVTFLPPLLLSIIFPTGFIIAIGFAGAVATIWACIVPALLAKKTRELPGSEAGFRVSGGNALIYILISYGIFTAMVHLLNMLGLLPVYSG